MPENKPYRIVKQCTIIFLLLFFSGAALAQEDSTEIVSPQVNVVEDHSSPQNIDRLEITDSAPVNVRTVPDSVVRRLKSDEDYWYADLAPKKKSGRSDVYVTNSDSSGHSGKRQDNENEQSSSRSNRSVIVAPWFRTLLWIIAILVFSGALIWYLASANILLFRKAPRPVDAQQDEESMPEDIFEIGYEKEIQRAIADKNYRLATRLLYLRTLRDLTEKNIIDFRQEKTNGDYLQELAGSSYYKDFFRLTREFEYTWYGQFDLSAETFALVENDFSSFRQHLA